MSAAEASVVLAFQAGLLLGLFAMKPEAWSLIGSLMLIGTSLAILRINRLHEDRP